MKVVNYFRKKARSWTFDWVLFVIHFRSSWLTVWITYFSRNISSNPSTIDQINKLIGFSKNHTNIPTPLSWFTWFQKSNITYCYKQRIDCKKLSTLCSILLLIFQVRCTGKEVTFISIFPGPTSQNLWMLQGRHLNNVMI